MDQEKIVKAINELKKDKKERKFKQSLDMIINLKGFDAKKESVNLFIQLPHNIKEKKIAGFLNKKSELLTTLTKPEFEPYKDKKKAKALAKKFDFFVSAASLMPLVAATFGKFLGPTGKMPSPQLGIVTEESDARLTELIKKIQNTLRVKSKEPSLKFCIGKDGMKESDIAENALVAYKAIVAALPRNKENIRNVLIKFTMTKPIKVE